MRTSFQANEQKGNNSTIMKTQHIYDQTIFVFDVTECWVVFKQKTD